MCSDKFRHLITHFETSTTFGPGIQIHVLVAALEPNTATHEPSNIPANKQTNNDHESNKRRCKQTQINKHAHTQSTHTNTRAGKHANTQTKKQRNRQRVCRRQTQMEPRSISGTGYPRHKSTNKRPSKPANRQTSLMKPTN